MCSRWVNIYNAWSPGQWGGVGGHFHRHKRLSGSLPFHSGPSRFPSLELAGRPGWEEGCRYWQPPQVDPGDFHKGRRRWQRLLGGLMEEEEKIIGLRWWEELRAWGPRRELLSRSSRFILGPVEYLVLLANWWLGKESTELLPFGSIRKVRSHYGSMWVIMSRHD